MQYLQSSFHNPIPLSPTPHRHFNPHSLSSFSQKVTPFLVHAVIHPTQALSARSSIRPVTSLSPSNSFHHNSIPLPNSVHNPFQQPPPCNLSNCHPRFRHIVVTPCPLSWRLRSQLQVIRCQYNSTPTIGIQNCICAFPITMRYASSYFFSQSRDLCGTTYLQLATDCSNTPRPRPLWASNNHPQP